LTSEHYFDIKDNETYDALLQKVRLSFYKQIKQILLSKYKIREENHSKDYSTFECFLENGCYIIIMSSGLIPSKISAVATIYLNQNNTYLSVSTYEVNLSSLEKWLDDTIAILSSVKLSKEL